MIILNIILSIFNQYTTKENKVGNPESKTSCNNNVSFG